MLADRRHNTGRTLGGIERRGAAFGRVQHVTVPDALIAAWRERFLPGADLDLKAFVLQQGALTRGISVRLALPAIPLSGTSLESLRRDCVPGRDIWVLPLTGFYP